MALELYEQSMSVILYQKRIRSLHDRLHVGRSRDLHLCNAGLGLGGELEELLGAVQGGNQDRIREEAGDVLSYLVFLADMFGVAVAGWATEEQVLSTTAWVGVFRTMAGQQLELLAYRAVTRLQESLKKLVFQQPRSEEWGRDRQALIVAEMSGLFLVVARIAASAKLTVHEVMLGNVEKLKGRYPLPLED
jgi:hypothetical protein